MKTDKIIWPCEECGTECARGVSGVIGRAGHNKHYCLKHYDAKLEEKRQIKAARKEARKQRAS